MLNYYESMENEDSEDYKITWDNADDIELKIKQDAKLYTHTVWAQLRLILKGNSLRPLQYRLASSNLGIS